MECKYSGLCQARCTNSCHVMTALKAGSIPPFLKRDWKKQRRLKTSAMCPRSSYRVTIQSNCPNTNCYFNFNNVAFHCLKIHQEAFKPQSNLTVISNLLDTDIVKMKLLLKISVYLIRLQIIMLKYISEYKKDIPIIDSSKLSIQTEIQLGNLTYEQEEFVEFWEEMLSRRITYKKDIRELVTQSITKIELVRQAIASLEIDGLRLKDVPFMYLIKVYRSIYGRVDVSNFGLDSAKGKQMLELFLEEEHV